MNQLANIKQTFSRERVVSVPERLKQWIHRPAVWGFLISMAVILVISVAFFYPDNIDGNTLAQHDTQQGIANGEEGRAYQEETGEKALWTNSLFSGMPTFQISPEYPSNSLFSWINTVYGLGLPVPSNLMFMMMFGFLIMLTCLGLRWWYALIGALAWGLSSYFIIIIGAGHIWKFVALSYVPPTIAGFIMIYRGRRLAGAALLALFMMMELNANHPQITYYFAFLMLFLAVGFLIKALHNKSMRKWLVSTAVALVAGIMALCANLPSIYNTYEYAKETKRAASELTPLPGAQTGQTDERPTGGLPKAEIGGWSNLPEESLSLLIPNIKGGASIKPEKGGHKQLWLTENEHYDSRMANSEPEVYVNGEYRGTYPLMSQVTDYFGGKGMTNGPFYVGALIVALFLLGCFIVPGTIKWVLLAGTVFSALLAMGNHFETLTDFMIYNVPLYNKFRAAETALVIACLCMPMMAVLALRRLFTAPEPLRNRNTVRGLSVAFVFPLFICVVAWLFPSVFGSAFTPEEADAFSNMAQNFQAQGMTVDPEQIHATVQNIESVRYATVSADALRSIWVLLAGAAIIFLALTRRLSRGLACLGIGLVVTVDLYSLDKRYVDHESFTSDLLTESVFVPDRLDREIQRDKDYYRVADIYSTATFQDARRSYFHHMIGGYHAAKLNRYNDLLERRLLPIAAYMPTTDADWNVLSMLNTRYIIYKDVDPSTGQETPALYRNDEAYGPAWLASDISYVDTPDQEMAALNVLADKEHVVADKKFADALGDSHSDIVPGDYIKLDEYTPNRLTYTVDTRNGGVAVFSEVWFPWGWTATVDGQEVPMGRVNYVLRAIRVPAGKHTVVMTFDPRSLHVTGGVAYAAVSLIYLLCLLALFVGLTRPEKDAQS